MAERKPMTTDERAGERKAVISTSVADNGYWWTVHIDEVRIVWAGPSFDDVDYARTKAAEWIRKHMPGVEVLNG